MAKQATTPGVGGERVGPRKSTIRRRDILALTAGVALAIPSVARAQRDRALSFVPTPDLTITDPILTTNRATRTHAHLVFDTLYGLDTNYTVQPQMVSGHTVENDGTLWTLRLRDGLKFHDGTPVLSRDVIASIRRWAARDDLGQSLMDATADLSGSDDLTIRFRLVRPFPHLPMALSGSTPIVSVIMPERLARTDPFRPVAEIIGSGPFRFVRAEFDPGVHVGYRAVHGLCAAARCRPKIRGRTKDRPF